MVCDMESLKRDLSAIDGRTSAVIGFNVVSSIAIILTNKAVFDLIDYKFATTMTFFHFVVTFLGLVVCWQLGLFTPKRAPMQHVLPLCLSFCGFVVLTNLSLQYNSVGFYQIAKIGTTPTVVVLETLYFGKVFSQKTKLSLIPVCLGVLLTSATDIQFNFIGAVYAFLGVLVTSMYQIWVGTKQKELGLDSMQLLFNQAPISAIMLLFLIPVFEDPSEILSYPYDTQSVIAIFISSVLAFCVNLSIFLVIGRTSAVTYNVVGYFKLALVVLGGFLLFQYPVMPLNILGIILTLSGVVIYTHIKLAETAAAQELAQSKEVGLSSVNVVEDDLKPFNSQHVEQEDDEDSEGRDK
jgi:solute carrier family 35 protein E3